MGEWMAYELFIQSRLRRLALHTGGATLGVVAAVEGEGTGGRERGGGGGSEGKMAAGEAVAFLPTRTVISSGHPCCKGGESSMSFGSSSLFGSGSYSSGKVSCSGHNINGKCGRRPRRSALVRAELMQASRPMRSFENRTRFLSLSLSLSLSLQFHSCLPGP